MKQPYRTSGWDPSVFEDNTDEYGVTASGSTPAVQQNSCHILLQLVKDGDFASALRVKADLEKLGVTIERNTLYMSVAVQHLARPPEQPAAAISAFNAWAELVPTLDALHGPEYSTFLSSPIFTKRADATTMRHAIVAAYLGYSSKIALTLVPHIIRSFPVKIGKTFMEVFAAADLAYRQQHRRHPAQEHRKFFKSWYALAIRTHCLGNRPEAGCMLLREAKARHYAIRTSTYRFLLKHLRASGDAANAAWVAEDLKMQDRQLTFPANLSVEGRHLLYDRLRRTLRAGHLPSRVQVYTFIQLCAESKDTNLANRLIKEVHGYPDYSVAVNCWVSAEMAYYFNNNAEFAALCVYREYFNSAGIPKAIEILLSQHDFSRLPVYLTNRPTPTARVWPNARVTLLFWRMLLSVLQPYMYKYAYREFISLFDAHICWANGSDPLSADSIRARHLIAKQRLPPRNAPNPFGMDHFRLFLHTFAKANDTLSLVAVIEKMRSYGWYPRRGDLEAITGCFARGGSPERLIPLLEELRRDAEKHAAAEDEFDDDRMVQNVPSHRPRATGMYRKAIAAFMATFRHADAAKMARHLRKKVGYTFGTHGRTDRTLGILYSELKAVSTHVISGSHKPAN